MLNVTFSIFNEYVLSINQHSHFGYTVVTGFLHAYVDELRIKLNDIMYITDKTTINFTKPGKLLRQSQVGFWSWNDTQLEIYMTVIIDIDVAKLASPTACSKVNLFRAGYVQSNRRCNVIVVYFLSCSYLEWLTDYIGTFVLCNS